jgi:HAD superfamily phosphoserine phosphatase-like hydrolase
MRKLKKAIKEELAGNNGQFAVFDFDNTCINGDIAETALHYLCQNNFLDKKILDNYYSLLGDGKIKEAYVLCSKTIAGFKALEISLLVERLALRKKTKKLIDFLKKNNIDIWIVTASPEALIQEAVRYYKIDCKVIGVKENEELLPMFEGKVDCIKKFINPNQKPLLAVGDSENDFAMLEYSKIKAVINRKTPFSQKARDIGWFLI